MLGLPNQLLCLPADHLHHCRVHKGGLPLQVETKNTLVQRVENKFVIATKLPRLVPFSEQAICRPDEHGHHRQPQQDPGNSDLQQVRSERGQDDVAV